MVKRSERLKVVLELEQRREGEALERMGQARQHWEAEQQRLQELQNYHSEYQTEMRGARQGKVTVGQLQSWQHFISRIAQAITQQQQRVELAARQFDEARQRWQETHERTRGMGRFIDQCRQQEQREDDRREQKHLDEAANNRYARRTRS